MNAPAGHPATSTPTRSLAGCLAKEGGLIHDLAFRAKCTPVSARLLAKNDLTNPRVVTPPHQNDDRSVRSRSLNNGWSACSAEERTLDILQTLETLLRRLGTPWCIDKLGNISVHVAGRAANKINNKQLLAAARPYPLPPLAQLRSTHQKFRMATITSRLQYVQLKLGDFRSSPPATQDRLPEKHHQPPVGSPTKGISLGLAGSLPIDSWLRLCSSIERRAWRTPYGLSRPVLRTILTPPTHNKSSMGYGGLSGPQLIYRC